MPRAILYVSSREMNRLLMERIVQHMGHELLLADDGHEGWRLWRSQRPALVIVDSDLDGPLTGQSLVRRVKLAHAGQPVVLTLAPGTALANGRSRAHGPDACLPKPADIQSIQALLTEQLARLPGRPGASRPVTRPTVPAVLAPAAGD